MECGCQAKQESTDGKNYREDNVEFCPLHKAAQETKEQRDALLEAATFVLDNSFCEYDKDNCNEPDGCPYCCLHAARAQAKGE